MSLCADTWKCNLATTQPLLRTGRGVQVEKRYPMHEAGRVMHEAGSVMNEAGQLMDEAGHLMDEAGHMR